MRKGWEWIRRKPVEQPHHISPPIVLSPHSTSKSETTHTYANSHLVSRPPPQMTTSTSAPYFDVDKQLLHSFAQGNTQNKVAPLGVTMNSRPIMHKSVSEQFHPPVRTSSLRRKAQPTEKSVEFDKRKSDGTMSIYNTFGSEDIQAVVDEPLVLKVDNSSDGGVNRMLNETKGGVRETHVLSKAALEDLHHDHTVPTTTETAIHTNGQQFVAPSQFQCELLPLVPNTGMDLSNDARRSTQSNATATSTEYESASMYSALDDVSSDSDLDSDDFVDALEPEEAERAKAEAKLSKRLSGHNFGSAGGLVLNIMDEPVKRNSFDLKAPPPDSLVKAMLEWKRSSLEGNKRVSLQSLQGLRSSLIRDMQTDTNSDKTETGKINERKKPTPLVSVPDIHLSPSSAVSTPKEVRFFVDSFSKSFDDLMAGNESLEITDLKDPRQLSAPQFEITPVSADEDEDDAARAAEALWDEDESFVEKEAMTEWLGQSKSLNARALHLYMKKFDFSHMRLDTAFRKLCSKLYLKAEAQVIDRVLEVFARRYWACNPDSLFGTSDVVYAVVYSLLLLNTDLHVAQGSHTRMTRSAFVKNTMMTVRDTRTPVEQNNRAIQLSKVWEDQMESLLRDMYASVKGNQILQPLQPGARKNGYLKRRMGSIRRSVRSSMLFTFSAEMKEQLGDETSETPTVAVNAAEPVARISDSASSATVTLAGISKDSEIEDVPAENTQKDTTDDSRYNKQGFAIRKHLLESADIKARQRNWSEIFLNTEDGQLCVYAVAGVALSDNANRKSVFRLSSLNGSTPYLQSSLAPPTNESTMTDLIGSNWKASTHLLDQILLSHSLANALPAPGYNRQRPFVFALQLPNGGVNLFQVSSAEEVNDWVDICNYWAARQSRAAAAGGVINMEYGWSDRLLEGSVSADTVNVYEWTPPAPSMGTSHLDEISQLNELRKHLDELNDQLETHCMLDKKIEAKFANRRQNQLKALNNWHNKLNYLRREIIKYDSYCNILTDAMARQDRRHRDIFSSTMQSSPLSIEESNIDLISELQNELSLVGDGKWF
ncbi:hypothetical protein K450DRAFT_243513 [Umbelopsis ramanniana AG]|uniref:SEC7 domain-containing protein n=1 Tax=Umbelopsis ramanniana AG TaxID=1314678 RepID=A0AAD5E9M9_UMBRA|nr:uncharacterized protein K450DRAFT_243513 [Umbelopsis ramanniana AG]KAI8579252.1 hypothetical protein K450DRAFT_243513 [Umbelopsis ramanniana AG]